MQYYPRGSMVIEVLLSLGLAAFLVASLGGLVGAVRRMEQSGVLRQRALAHMRESLELVTANQRQLFICSTTSVGPGTCTRSDGQTCTLATGYQSCWTTHALGLSTDTPLHLVFSGGNWQLASGSESVTGDTLFTRTVSVATLSRDGTGTLVASGGTVDPNTKRITVAVSWDERGSTKSLSLSTMLTGWRNVTP